MGLEPVLGVDVGGTFTDFAYWDGGALSTGKRLTTPDQSEGVVAGAEALAPAARTRLLHGTTVATNTLLQHSGARTALVTSAGFGDVLEIGRQDRPSLYDPAADRPLPLVPADLRFSDQDMEALAASDAEAVAVALLYGFRRPTDEQKVAVAVRRVLPRALVSTASAVAPEFREFERFSTTVINAYLAPATAGYLRGLRRRVAAAGLRDEPAVMRSSGGLMSAAAAETLPAAILLSGPAAGVVAAAAIGTALGRPDLISFDMGGTSTDVCRIEGGRPVVGYGRAVEGYPCLMPAISIHTIGAGGGSIAWADPGGALRVGPRSAGAHPGPACYGLGGVEATVTDANLLIGRIDPDTRLAGALVLLPDRARQAVAALGDALRLAPDESALGVVRVVETHMQRALRTVSIEEGSDPRRATLLAFGGAGGLHATALARSLDMTGVLVPPHAGVLSALGLLLSAPRADTARTVLLEREGRAQLSAALGVVAAEAAAALREASGQEPAAVATMVDARYRGQSHETTVPLAEGEDWEALASRFHRAHAARNGFSRPGDPIEAVTVRGEATGRSALTWEGLAAPQPVGEPQRGARPVLTADGRVEASRWWRPGLTPGAEIVGPAVIEEPQATTYLGPGERLVVHESGTLEVEW